MLHGVVLDFLECRDRALPASTFRMGVRELQESKKKGVFGE